MQADVIFIEPPMCAPPSGGHPCAPLYPKIIIIQIYVKLLLILN